MREHVGGFSKYLKEELLELVGFSNCVGCPGGNIEYVPEEMIRNGAEVIHFATGFVVGYPPCPYITQFKEFIEFQYHIPVVVGTHPIPLKYLNTHSNLSSWKAMNMQEICGPLMTEDRKIIESFN